MDGVALIEQEGVQRQPVVAGGLHADGYFARVRGDFGNPGEQAFRAFGGVGERKAFEQRFPDAFPEHGCHMMLLADIDSKVEHCDHRRLCGFWVRVLLRTDERHRLVVDTKLALWHSIQLIRSLFTGRRRQSFKYEPDAHGVFDASPPNGSIIAYSR